MTWIFSESAPAGLVSVGPASRMAARRLIPNEWFVKVYEPVIFVGESVPGLHGAFDYTCGFGAITCTRTVHHESTCA